MILEEILYTHAARIQEHLQESKVSNKHVQFCESFNYHSCISVHSDTAYEELYESKAGLQNENRVLHLQLQGIWL